MEVMVMIMASVIVMLIIALISDRLEKWSRKKNEVIDDPHGQNRTKGTGRV
jgi:hypothetical protein